MQRQWVGAWACLLLFLEASTANAATQAQIDQAVDRGVRYLLSVQAADGTWQYPGHPVGGTSLVGLALVESGVKPNDPAIQKAAEYVRNQASRTTDTYSVALAIMFLDSLGDKNQAPVIAALGQRLRDGQLSGGGWTYNCQRGGEGFPPGLGFGGPAMLGGGDNSNTQFALLALWVARRHGVDGAAALAQTDKHFRGSQAQDGGWNYVSFAGAGLPGGAGVAMASSGSMTCAGLLGLAAQHGSQNSLRAGNNAKDLQAKAKNKAAPNAAAAGAPLEDPAVQAGLKCLSQHLSGQAPGRLGLGTELYFLWSVERVGVTYGLQKIGNVDWYAAGVDILLPKQAPDGSWADYSQSVGTSFALLFLNRANVAPDLTQLLTGKPAGRNDSTLRSGRDTEALKDLAAGNRPAAAPRAAPERPKAALDVAKASPAELLAALADADTRRQLAILSELRDRKGGEATVALGDAVARLPVAEQAKGRAMLAVRLERMTAATLGRYLEYDHDEIRQAAAKAAATKGEASLSGKLIELLGHENEAVGDAAHEALTELTRQNFGRFEGANTTERFVVIQRWKSWWAKQSAETR